MADKSEATILFLRVSGEQAVQSAIEVLSRVLSGMIPAEAMVEPAKRIAPTYEKAPDEPDGFSGPAPVPSTPSFVVDRKQKVKVVGADKPARPPGALAAKILGILDRGTGVAPLEHLVDETGVSAHGLNMAITKCPQLKRLDDGRIALAGYRDED